MLDQVVVFLFFKIINSLTVSKAINNFVIFYAVMNGSALLRTLVSVAGSMMREVCQSFDF